MIARSDDEWEALPDGIAPHEGFEYSLMAQGQKAVAMFSDVIPDAFISNPNGLRLGFIAESSGSAFSIIFYLAGYKDEAQWLLALNRRARNIGFHDATEREIGRVLGYEDWQIDAFLQHVRHGLR